MENFAVDEFLFVYINNQALWVLGIRNNTNKKIRLELSFNRNSNILKKIY